MGEEIAEVGEEVGFGYVHHDGCYFVNDRDGLSWWLLAGALL